MKLVARMQEGGRRLHAGNNDDWAIARPADGKRPELFCPECGNQVTAYQRPADPEPGQETTRYFAFVKGHHCEHREVKEGVKVTHPGESPEHAWLKEYVRRAAVHAGYTQAQLEVTLAGGKVRADVYVSEASHRRRVEVQRVATDVPTRTGDFPDTVWLLRNLFQSSNNQALFNQPCVQVAVTTRDATGRPLPARPWDDGQAASVRATSTVLQLRPVEQLRAGEKNWDATKLSLDDFLRQVWSGHRKWHPRGELGTVYAGWITVDDEQTFTSWQAELARQAREEQQRLQEEHERLALAESEAQQERDRQEAHRRQRQAEEERALREERQRAERAQSVERMLDAADPTRRPLAPAPAVSPGWWSRMRRWWVGRQ